MQIKDPLTYQPDYRTQDRRTGALKLYPPLVWGTASSPLGRGHELFLVGPNVTKDSLPMACEVKSKWCGPNSLQASLPTVTLETLLESP